jgi:hypothetical protein
MAVPEGYDVVITLDGVKKYFKVNRKTYRVSDLSAFTPRVGTGGVTRGDQDHQNAFEQVTFHGGMGQKTMVEDTRYRYATNLDPRHSGVLSLFTKTDELAITGLTGRPVMATDGNYLYIGGTGGVWAWDGTDLEDIGSGLANQNVIGMFYNGENLFVGLAAHRIHRFTGTVAAPAWTECGVSYADLTDDFSARAFAIYDGKHWHSQDNTNLLHWWWMGDGTDAETGINVSLLDGSYTHPAEGIDYDPTAVEVGTLNYPIKNMIQYDKYLYVFKQDGIYRIGPNGAGGYYAEEVMNMTHYVSMGSFYDSVTFENAALWFGHRNRFERMVNKSTTNFTPPETTDDHPPVLHDRVQAVMGLYDQVFSLISGQLYTHNGSAPHLLVANVSDTVTTAPLARSAGNRPSAMAYFPGHDLYPVLAAAVYSSDDGYTTLYYWHVFDEHSRVPFAESGYLETSSYDAGFVDVPKYWHSVKVEFHIPSKGGTIDVTAYSYEDGDITEYDLGVITSADAEPTVGGRWNRGFKTFYFPKTARGKWIDLKFTLTRAADSSSESPLMYAYVLEYVLRPPTIYGYAPQFLLSDNEMLHGQWRDGETVAGGLDTLEDIRDSVTPVYYEDYFGHRAWVYMATIVERDAKAVSNDYQDSDVTVQTSFVVIQRDCNNIVVDVDQALIAEGYYTVDCTLTLEDGASLTIN